MEKIKEILGAFGFIYALAEYSTNETLSSELKKVQKDQLSKQKIKSLGLNG